MWFGARLKNLCTFEMCCQTSLQSLQYSIYRDLQNFVHTTVASPVDVDMLLWVCGVIGIMKLFISLVYCCCVLNNIVNTAADRTRWTFYIMLSCWYNVIIIMYKHSQATHLACIRLRCLQRALAVSSRTMKDLRAPLSVAWRLPCYCWSPW